MLHTETVDAGTLGILKSLMSDEVLSAFSLVGGTALSLSFGHRMSYDIDLFTDKEFDSLKVAEHLNRNYNVQELTTLKNGIFCYINDVKIDMIAHQYPIINKIQMIEGIRMLSLEDIGGMKLNAILHSGSRLKDFVDMYFLLEHTPLKNITTAFVQKYPDVNVQMAHNALLYHQEIRVIQKINFVGKKIEFPVIAERLSEAVLNNEKIFKSQKVEYKINLIPKKSEGKKKGRRPG